MRSAATVAKRRLPACSGCDRRRADAASRGWIAAGRGRLRALLRLPARPVARPRNDRRGDPPLAGGAQARDRAFLAGGLKVIAHCGAQSTAATVELAEHAAAAGVEGVAVIAPPYFPLDDRALLAHFAAAAAACSPTPFYVYEFARASGTRSARGARALARAGPEPGRPQGLRRAVGGVRAVPRRGSRRLRRPGGADRAGHACVGGRRRVRSRPRFPSA